MSKPIFGKKHYEAIAQVLSKRDWPPPKEQIVKDLAAMFAADNPHFDAEKFYLESGLKKV